MIDRQSQNPGRVKITLDDGTVMYGTIERADEPSVVGTPLNKNTLFNSINSERYACELPSEAFGLLTNEPVVIVPASAWSSSVDSEGYYTNRVNVIGMKEKFSPIFAPVFDNASNVEDLESAFIDLKRVTTHDGYVVFKALKPLTLDINIKLKGV